MPFIERAYAQVTSAFSAIAPRIPNPRSLAQLPLLATPLAEVPTFQRSQPQSCPNAQLSCHNSTIVPDTCCFNYPGGQILQTQFWDTHPAVGPVDSWTIHGLWPDRCDGSFEQYCDSSRSFNNITQILQSYNETALLFFMKIYWKDYQGSDPTLWSHEWNKHGTCVSTMETKCYSDYSPQEEVVDYFQKTVELFKTLPTFKILSDAGIVPDRSKTYTSAQIESALEAAHGAQVTIRCRGREFNEVWYHFDVQGSAQTGEWVPSPPDGAKSNCPASGLKYLLKDMSSFPTPTSKTTSPPDKTKIPSPTSTNPGKPFSGAGYLEVLIDGNKKGCLIGDGSWYTSGTCATYHAEDDASKEVDGADDDHLFTLTTRKGPCGFINGGFVCAKSVGKQDIFHSAKDGILALKTNTHFYADSAPGHAQRGKIFAEKGDHKLELQIEWKAI